MVAGRYTFDPETGMPYVQTAGGAALPLPLSRDDMTAAGLQLPDVPAPPAGPDLRLAYNGAGGPGVPDDFNTPPDVAGMNEAARVADIRNALAPKPGTNEHASAPTGPGWMPRGDRPPPGPPRIDPSTLARGGGGQATPGGAEQGGGMDPAVEAVFKESLRGGGGGGPRQLGVTGETQKFTRPQFAMDPALAAQAQEAEGASDKYNEELAKSLQVRQEQAYQAQQHEFAARSGQMAAQQQRFEQQQAMLQDYAAKRDAAMQEAAQMKTPQMEDYWQSRGTFANVMTGLSIALGGALQGLRGGQNPGLEMSNQSIDRWIASQREEYQRAVEHGRELDNQYGRMVQMFGSENLAQEHLREQAWTVRDGMLKSYAEHIGTPDALELYNQAMLQSEAEKAKLRARASQGAEVQIEQKLSMQGGGGGGSATLLAALEKAARAKKAVDTIGGNDKDGPKPSDLKELNQSDAALTSVSKLLNSVPPGQELPGLAGHNVISRGFRGAADWIGGEGSGSAVLDSPEERANRQRVEYMKSQITHALTGAGMSDREREMYNQMILGARTTSDLRNIVSAIQEQNGEQRRLIGGGKPTGAAPAAASEEAVR